MNYIESIYKYCKMADILEQARDFVQSDYDSKTISQEGQCTALHFSIFRIGKKGRNMNGLNLDEIAVLLERHGITCVVRNENGMEALRAFRGLPLPNRNDEQEDKLK